MLQKEDMFVAYVVNKLNYNIMKLTFSLKWDILSYSRNKDNKARITNFNILRFAAIFSCLLMYNIQGNTEELILKLVTVTLSLISCVILFADMKEELKTNKTLDLYTVLMIIGMVIIISFSIFKTYVESFLQI